MADVSLYAYAHVAGDAGIDMGAYPAVGAWLGRVEATPGFVDDLEPYPENARAGAGGPRCTAEPIRAASERAFATATPSQSSLSTRRPRRAAAGPRCRMDAHAGPPGREPMRTGFTLSFYPARRLVASSHHP